MNADFFLVRRTLSLLKDHGDGYLSVKITRRWQRTKARNIKKGQRFDCGTCRNYTERKGASVTTHTLG